MWFQFLENVVILFIFLSTIVSVYMILCRDSHHFRGLDKEQDKIFLHAFINRIYFVLTTLLTIGYGDIAPATIKCRVITIIMLLVVFMVVLKSFDSLITQFAQQFPLLQKQ
jgi:hypothetical protein